ncbi:MAG TPA: hypothetical protein VNM92_02390 [Thermoanaerobaculia bacterium]|nr:hypothetical protein [Thermoanaerobaculia bacterium]
MRASLRSSPTLLTFAHVTFPIYFSGSISGGRSDASLYRTIVDRLQESGYEVLAGAVADPSTSASGETLSSRELFERDLRWIADVATRNGALVAEVSVPSTGVGYEIATARHRFDLPVICLYRPAYTKRCSAMIAGDRGIRLIEYSETSVAEMLETLVAVLSRLR